MEKLSDNAKELFDELPEDGTAISGGNLKFALEISDSEFRQAKAELKEAGLVRFGRGRGGSVARLEGAEVVEIPTPTPEERMAVAREVKVAKSRERRERDELEARVKTFASKGLDVPEERIHVTFFGAQMTPIIEVRNGKGSSLYTVKQEYL